jgi:hypothetical protein
MRLMRPIPIMTRAQSRRPIFVDAMPHIVTYHMHFHAALGQLTAEPIRQILRPAARSIEMLNNYRNFQTHRRIVTS